MSLYLGDAAAADFVEDPKGCYVGQGKIWIETTSTTAVFKTESVDGIARLVKVPAAEFRNLMAHGVTRFTLRHGRLEASNEDFHAALPCRVADQYSTDIRIVDHEPLDPAVAVSLMDLIGRAMAFSKPDAANAAYRFIYAAERRVFATDGNRLFVGRLPGYLARRMVFTNAASLDLTRLWKRVVPTQAMHSPRSLLCKNAQLASATRCVETPVPTPLYRLVRTAALADAWVALDLPVFRSAVECLLLAAGVSDPPVSLRVEPEVCTLKGCMGVSVLETIAWQGTPRRHLEVSLRQVVQAALRLDTERVLLGHLSGLGSHLALASGDAGVVIAISARKER